MEVGSLPNHVNSCVLCVCLLFNFRLFTVIDLSPGCYLHNTDTSASWIHFYASWDEWKLLGNQWFLIRGAGNFYQIGSRGDKCVIEEEIWSQIEVSQFILYNQTQKFPSCFIPKFSIWHHYNEHAFKIIKLGGNTTKTKERSWAWCHDPHFGWNFMNMSYKRDNVWL